METTFTEEAANTVAEMREAVDVQRRNFGHESVEYLRSLESFLNVVGSIMRLKGRVMRDGIMGDSNDLSLICQNEYLTYGVVYDANNVTWSVHS